MNVLATLPLLAAATAAAPPAAQEREHAVHIEIAGELDLGSLALLQRAVRQAHAHEARHLIVELDTPGGSIDLMWQAAKALEQAVDEGLLVSAWVNEEALSAGVLLALSCRSIYMHPRGTLGSALPIAVLPGGIAPLPEAGGVREKMISSMRAQFRASAEENGRHPVLAEAMVDPDVEVREIRVDGVTRIVSGIEYDDARERGDAVELVRTLSRPGQLLNLTAREAVELGFADGVAEDLDTVLELVGAAGAEVVRVERSRSEDVLGNLNRIGALLLVAGLVLAFLELKQPGFGLPGLLALACFALLLLGRYMVGLADIPHLVLATVGVVLIAVEILLVPGTLWVGVLGALALAAGLVLGQVGPNFTLANPLDRALAWDATFELTMAGFGGMLGAWFLSRWLPETPGLRRLVLTPAAGQATPATGERIEPGATGIARTALRPVGKVELDGVPGLEYEARSAGAALERGTAVRVVESVGGRLVVEQREEPLE